MKNADKNRTICRLAEVLAQALTEDGLKDSNDVRDAINMIREVDANYARVTLAPVLERISTQHRALAKHAGVSGM